MRTVFIYALCEPGTRKVRYIGKTCDLKRRFQTHLRISSRHKSHLGNWLRSLGGVLPNLVTLRGVPEVEGSSAETQYIRVARESLGMNLVNGTDGGEGVVNPSPEWRAAVSARMTGKNHPLFGKHPSLETRAKRRASSLGQKNHFFGKHHSPGASVKMSAARIGKRASEQTRAKMTASRLGKKRGPYKKRL